MAEMYCPNCGHRLVKYRTDRQSAGRRQVVLHWHICEGCRHVALKNWSFADGIMPNPPSEQGAYEARFSRQSYSALRSNR